MHKADLRGVAYGGAAGLCVFDNIECHILICRFVHINVADARSRLDTGHRGILNAGIDELCSASGDEQIHISVGFHQLVGALSGGVCNESDALCGKSCGNQTFLQCVGNGECGMKGFLPSAENAGIAAFYRQRRRICGHVGSAFIDNGDDADGHGDPADDHAVGAGHAGELSVHGIGQLRNLTDALRHGFNAAFTERQTIQHHFGDQPAGVLHIRFVCLENVFFMHQQRFRHGEERPVLRLLRGCADFGTCLLCGNE